MSMYCTGTLVLQRKAPAGMRCTSTITLLQYGEIRSGVCGQRGSGGDVLGHPFHPVAWLASHLAAQGSGLRAGDIVMTGSIVTTKFPDRPASYRFDVKGLGSVDVTVTT